MVKREKRDSTETPTNKGENQQQLEELADSLLVFTQAA